MKKKIWTIILIVVGAVSMFGSLAGITTGNTFTFQLIGNVGLIIMVFGLYMIKSEKYKKEKKMRICSYCMLYIILLGVYNLVLTGAFAWSGAIILGPIALLFSLLFKSSPSR